MENQVVSRLPADYSTLPPTRTTIICICYLLLNIGLTLIMTKSFLLGIGGIVIINLLVLLFLHYRWAIPLYILVAGPSMAIPLGGNGISSRLFAGNLMIILPIIIGAARRIASRPASGESLCPASLMIPLTMQAIVGLISIIFSRWQPDPEVTYSFPHAQVPMIIVNSMEMILLLGMPVVVMSVPGLIQTTLAVKWIVRAFICLGMLYAIGTIFAGPLGLYSHNLILGIRRPQVFSSSGSSLGLILVFFTCIALGQGLYARQREASNGWWLCTIILSIAVILAFGRDAWLGLFVSGLVMISFYKKALAVLPLLIVVLLLLLVPGVTDFFDPNKVYGIDRLIMWQDAINIWLRHPYMGVGAGNYQFFDIAYGTDVGGIAHNQFLEVLAEQGLQGLFCLLWTIVAIGYLAVQRFQTATTACGRAIALAYIGYYAALLLTCFFGDSFLPSVAVAGGTSAIIEASYNWLLLGLVLTLPQWEKSMAMQKTLIEAETI